MTRTILPILSSTTSIFPWMTGGLLPCANNVSDLSLPLPNAHLLTLFSAPSSIALASSWNAGENAVDQDGKQNDMAALLCRWMATSPSSAAEITWIAYYYTGQLDHCHFRPAVLSETGRCFRDSNSGQRAETRRRAETLSS